MYQDADNPAALRALVLRALGPSADGGIERVPEGVSTHVYRITRGPGTFYLRVLPEAGATFAPEVLAHTLLRERGVLAPEVVYYEPCEPRLARSVMITTAIPGRPLADRPLDTATPGIVAEVGRQLAVLNSVPVAGFGWTRRDCAHATALEAEHPTNRAFLTEHLEADLAAVETQLLGHHRTAVIRAVIAAHPAWLDADRATLAHGDFDTTPIFQHEGRYTGMIDFGEIRGADRWYDLGHFHMHDGESQPTPLLEWLLDGYQSVTPLPFDARRRITFASLLIAVRALTRALQTRPQLAPHHQALVSIPRDLAVLLD
jgi:Ser/Thr protein kinase RdoA (MazF antagonist)